jgi:hypothetical protein
MINPHLSPWNKPKFTRINDVNLYRRWNAIKKYLTTQVKFTEYSDMLLVEGNFYIAKHSNKMRLKSHLDWAYYTPKTLANAIDNNCISSYYEIMLNDVNSDPNIWKDKNFELELKSFYAARIGRASLI